MVVPAWIWAKNVFLHLERGDDLVSNQPRLVKMNPHQDRGSNEAMKTSVISLFAIVQQTKTRSTLGGMVSKWG